MTDRGISHAELESIVAAPTRGRYAPRVRDRREWCGLARDGRPLTVVTNRAGTLAISVFEQ